MTLSNHIHDHDLQSNPKGRVNQEPFLTPPLVPLNAKYHNNAASPAVSLLLVIHIFDLKNETVGWEGKSTSENGDFAAKTRAGHHLPAQKGLKRNLRRGLVDFVADFGTSVNMIFLQHWQLVLPSPRCLMMLLKTTCGGEVPGLRSGAFHQKKNPD